MGISAETFNTLQNQYKIKIKVSNKTLLTCKFTGSLQIENIEKSLEYLKEIYSFDVQKINGVYNVKGGLCK